MVKAVIFDMDGVISDTQKLHAEVESKLLARFGVVLSPEEITKRYAGVRTREFFSRLLEEQGAVFDIDQILEEKWEEMAILADDKVEEIPGSIALIKSLKAAKFPLAVASASNLRYVTTVLKKLGVDDAFDSVVSGDMVQKGKPDPESFLLAATNLGISPEQCLVIEDGISGMEAARSAGMYCIGLVHDLTKIYPTANLVSTMEEITLDRVRALS
jgi:beta-phosphoglucomutase family hydrolase